VPAALKAYVVGGAVRDTLLGRPGSDRDWVVVGATPAQMVDAGFVPVGRDFPVFLHPQTREEYALARTERKTAPGYRGFAFHADPGVTLEEDLGRRDLTINAMAFDSQGRLVDPHGGQRDLEQRVLRHVSAAFAEDPVRLLRLARFAARYPDFSVAPETIELGRRMVAAGEVDALVAERVWNELARGLMETRPSRMLDVLRQCLALAPLLPEVDRLWDGTRRSSSGNAAAPAGEHLLRVLDSAAALGASLPVRFACLVHDVDADPAPTSRRSARARRSNTAREQLCDRLRVPIDCRELAVVVARESAAVHGSAGLDAAALLDLLERCDALRRPERFDDVLLACECDARGWPDRQAAPYPQRPSLRRILQRALAVDSRDIALRAAAQGHAGVDVGRAIRAARIAALDVELQREASGQR
jgi:tRNA nucleotidyltransferase (CCA-adding enzyme)